MVPHPAFAVAITKSLVVTTSIGVNGPVIALGWWVDAGAADNPEHEPTGTLYLVVDETKERPMWVTQGDLTSTRLDHPPPVVSPG
jgi:hypothetical protein